MAKTLARKQQKRGGKRARKTQKRMRGGNILKMAILLSVLIATSAHGGTADIQFHHGKGNEPNKLVFTQNVYDKIIDIAEKNEYKNLIKKHEGSLFYLTPDTYSIDFNCKDSENLLEELNKNPKIEDNIRKVTKTAMENLECGVKYEPALPKANPTGDEREDIRKLRVELGRDLPFNKNNIVAQEEQLVDLKNLLPKADSIDKRAAALKAQKYDITDFEYINNSYTDALKNKIETRENVLKQKKTCFDKNPNGPC